MGPHEKILHCRFAAFRMTAYQASIIDSFDNELVLNLD